MYESKLFKLIKNIEYGTNLHISVVFLDDAGNKETNLPISHNYHVRNICLYFKSLDNQEKCMRCRNIVIKKAIRSRRAFGGICVNGVYEFCKLLIVNDKVVCVIFVGNIMPSGEKADRLRSKVNDVSLLDDLEKNCSEDQVRSVADAVGDYIKFLLVEYAEKSNENFNPLIENIRSFIEENLTYEFEVKDISNIFNYNEKYLGKLFKAKTGVSIKEYANLRRVDMAADMLERSYLHITEISSRVGFNNVSYFNRVFKRIKGMSPTKYRVQK